MQCAGAGAGAVVARRGLERLRRTRGFTLRDLHLAASVAAASGSNTVYVETDAEGYVCGARGESAALVAVCARAAPPPARAGARLRLDAAGGLYLELTAGLAPHHDLTVWPPPAHLLLLPAATLLVPPPVPYSLPSHSTGAVVAAEGEGAARAAGAARGAGHECGYCGRRYSRRYGLRIHERTHTGARPLRCPHCARAFADPSNLNKHVRLHQRDADAATAGAGAIPCPRCPRRLARRRDLLRHLRSHDARAAAAASASTTSPE